MADFFGLATGLLENEHLRLEYLLDAGPRIVRLFRAGSDENLLAEVPDLSWDTPYGLFHLWGGHRLWHAPEKAARTYVPDDVGLVAEEVAGGVFLRQPADSVTGIAKAIEIRLAPGLPVVTLRHTLRNEGLWPVELAAWAITQLPLGGVALLPQRRDPLDEDRLQPNRQLTLWPYSRWQDQRLRLGDDLVLVEGTADPVPLKVGYLNDHGWLAYLREGVLFGKWFQRSAVPSLNPRSYPDMNSNVEVYVKDRFLELETLGPLTLLEPGESLQHSERWEIDSAPEADFETVCQWMEEETVRAVEL